MQENKALAKTPGERSPGVWRPPLALYLHIPFCHARCGYCDFVTFTGKEDRIDAYILQLLKEAELYHERAGERSIHTLFLGGGTPSILEPAQTHRLFEGLRHSFIVEPHAEVTLEANPESVTPEKAKAWREAGINRISIGLQTMDDALLKRIERLHTAQEFKNAYATLRESGFSNLSIDLIYGLPGQTLAGWQDTLRATLALKPEHLSLYALAVEPHTPFAAAGIRTDSDEQAALYAWAREFLSNSGYPQYEISNFARPGCECRHNLVYWRQQDYLGLGIGAVGCVDGRRWENVKTLDAYEKLLAANARPRATEEILDEKTRKFERLMLGLRLREGFVWGEESDPAWSRERDRLAAEGLLEQIAGRWRIAEAAVPLTNQVLLPFV